MAGGDFSSYVNKAQRFGASDFEKLQAKYHQNHAALQVPQIISFEPSLDAFSLRSDVIGSIKIYFLLVTLHPSPSPRPRTSHP